MGSRNTMDALVVGGGAWGTTLASLLARQGRTVRLWVREKETAAEINRRHVNDRFLPGFKLPVNLRAVTDLKRAIKGTPFVLMVVPSKHFRAVARSVGEAIEGDQILVHATKGIEVGSFKRMTQVLREETCALKIGVLSGPNLAREIMEGHPAGALLASRFDNVLDGIQPLFQGGTLRVYCGSDVIGAEVGGSFKNIIALAAGAADGMGLGANSRSLLMTRGLIEMARFGTALGADVLTFGGLAGIGDLMATCGSELSRNHQVGVRLAAGEGIEPIVKSMHQVAEGVTTTAAVFAQARSMGLDLNIVRTVHQVLYEGLSPRQALEEMMAAPVGREL